MSNLGLGSVMPYPHTLLDMWFCAAYKLAHTGGSKIITVARGEKLPTVDLYYIAFIVVVAALISRRMRL